MIIDKTLLDVLSAQAKDNPRLRQNNRASESRGKARFDYAECGRLKRVLNYDLRTSSEDGSQRMLNALGPGTVMPIHRHIESSESITMIRGKMIMRLYDDNGTITNEFTMEPCGEYPMVQVEAGQWHSLEVLEEGTIIFEAKDGKYVPLREEDIMKVL